MTHKEIKDCFDRLRRYCEAEDFRGWDPYDGLNSKVFRALPLVRKSTFCRLAMIQGMKRCPVNLRRLLLVPKGHNPKGLALFLQGYCNLYRACDVAGERGEIVDKINYLAELLISLRSEGDYHGACWGYDFGWQSKAFFLPKWTPTVVATSFAVEALFSAYEITGNKKYYDYAVSTADFVMKDLQRIPSGDGFMFSYSPLDNRAVYNASLLGSKILALVYNYTHNQELREMAVRTALAVCKKQNADGSFPHSDQVGQAWRDNFHTAFKLESLAIVQRYCGASLDGYIDKGYRYWVENYFDKDSGIARYYDRNMSPGLIDLHCFAESIPAFFKLSKMDEQKQLVQKEIEWAVNNMFSPEGYFYFQKNGGKVNKIPYMRWPNAWCFYGLSYWLLYVMIKKII